MHSGGAHRWLKNSCFEIDPRQKSNPTTSKIANSTLLKLKLPKFIPKQRKHNQNHIDKQKVERTIGLFAFEKLHREKEGEVMKMKNGVSILAICAGTAPPTHKPNLAPKARTPRAQPPHQRSQQHEAIVVWSKNLGSPRVTPRKARDLLRGSWLGGTGAGEVPLGKCHLRAGPCGTQGWDAVPRAQTTRSTRAVPKSKKVRPMTPRSVWVPTKLVTRSVGGPITDATAVMVGINFWRVPEVSEEDFHAECVNPNFSEASREVLGNIAEYDFQLLRGHSRGGKTTRCPASFEL